MFSCSRPTVKVQCTPKTQHSRLLASQLQTCPLRHASQQARPPACLPASVCLAHFLYNVSAEDIFKYTGTNAAFLCLSLTELATNLLICLNPWVWEKQGGQKQTLKLHLCLGLGGRGKLYEDPGMERRSLVGLGMAALQTNVINDVKTARKKHCLCQVSPWGHFI